MAKEITKTTGRHASAFERIRKINEAGNEYWESRDLAEVLEYTQYRNFEAVVEKAKMACFNSGQRIEDHFADVSKMIEIGKGGMREVAVTLLSRYACYLIIQNADPSKEIVAQGQTYFAVQTRKQELIEQKLLDHERIQVREKLTQTEKQLTGLAFERGVDGMGIARIRSKGDAVLFGGNSTKSMKQKLGVSDDRSLADFLPTILLKAKDLAAEVTNHNIREKKSLQ